MVREEVAPGVALAAGGDHLLAQALTPQSRPGRVLVHLTPAAAPAPTHDPGPGVDPGLLGVVLDPGPIQTLQLSAVVVPNPGALLLRPLQG